jgi:hypothetical protein
MMNEQVRSGAEVAESPHATKLLAVVFKKKIPTKAVIDQLRIEIAANANPLLIEVLDRMMLMEEALEHCRWRPHEHNPVSEDWIGPTRCDVIDRALGL